MRMAPAVPRAIGGRPMPPHPSPHLSPINQEFTGVRKGQERTVLEGNWRKSAGQARRHAAAIERRWKEANQSQGYWFESNRGSKAPGERLVDRAIPIPIMRYLL